MIERIQQRGPNDCGIASIAMACGVPYETVAPLLESGSGAGINEFDMYEWLTANGWAWQIQYPNGRRAGRYYKNSPWPPKPFAPSHIALVSTPASWHFTVMDAGGEVFDPNSETRKALDHPDYRDVSWVMGLWPVGPALSRPHQSAPTPSKVCLYSDGCPMDGPVCHLCAHVQPGAGK